MSSTLNVAKFIKFVPRKLITMTPLSQEQIKKIADELDWGHRCFWDQQTNDLLFLPDFDLYPDGEELYQEDIDKLENGSYLQIEPMPSHEAFEIMTGFIDSLDNTIPLKGYLILALNKRKPFREFKYVIDNSGPYRNIWFAFKEQEVIGWVKKQVAYLSD